MVKYVSRLGGGGHQPNWSNMTAGQIWLWSNLSVIWSLWKDINLLMKILKLAVGERHEIINKYKIINITLSKIYEFGQKTNLLTPLEETKFINYDKLLR